MPFWVGGIGRVSTQLVHHFSAGQTGHQTRAMETNACITVVARNGTLRHVREEGPSCVSTRCSSWGGYGADPARIC